MQNPLDDTKWARSYGSTTSVRAAFDRLGHHYHEAIWATGLPQVVGETVASYLHSGDKMIDFGCGSGVLGLALAAKERELQLDGLDFSPVMLELARQTGCYRELYSTNLLLPKEFPPLASALYDGAISLGLIGDYVPYYLALPRMRECLRLGSWLGVSVERSCTPHHALEIFFQELNFHVEKEIVLQSPPGQLEAIDYQFYVLRLH